MVPRFSSKDQGVEGVHSKSREIGLFINHFAGAVFKMVLRISQAGILLFSKGHDALDTLDPLS